MAGAADAAEFRGANRFGQKLGAGANAFTVFMIARDGYIYYQGGMSDGEFVYSLSGNTAVLAIGYAGFNWLAIGVGAAHYAAPHVYEGVKVSAKVYNNAIEEGSRMSSMFDSFASFRRSD